MLEKNVDMAVIGHNYLSYLFGFDLLSKKQKILILDDERIKYGGLFGRQLSELERVFLKTWGEDNKLEPLINIDRFLSQQDVHFYINKTKLVLGASPFENLYELSRKFPNFFLAIDGEFGVDLDTEKKESFDVEFLSFCHRMGRNACRFSNLQNLSIDTFLNHCPVELKKIFTLFKENIRRMILDTSNHWDYKSLIYGAKSFYQSRMSIASSDLEIFHLFHCLISPFYLLNEDKIIEEILPLFESRGGQLKRTHVREWKFYKRSPWSLELASFEGIIHPARVALLGGLPEKLPLKVRPDNKCYKNVVSSVKFYEQSHLSKGVHILVRDNRIGTDQSLIVLDNISDQSMARAQQFVLKRKGQKIDFFKSSLRDWLSDDLHYVLGEKIQYEAVEEFHFGDEVFISEPLNFFERSNIHLPKKTKIYDSANPLYKSKLDNVFYFGPYKDAQLGLLTAMVDIKEAQQFL
ncbi:hypothetical protein [Halobacteriovorax sp. HLS]|uniref:hypothetical protein n=1 Tax=Halobacteriovorax sp. HLS TaxID=2234000 RepID=UPI000FDA4666|nr:hypothetical protein [Halobacteriovorax sp. HLS]